MNAPSVDFKNVLEDEELGTFGTDLFISAEPASPDSCVTLYDYNQITAPMINPTLYGVQTCFLQIRVRDPHFATAWAKCEEILDAVVQQASKFTTDGVHYIDVLKINGPMFIKKDDSNRTIVVANVRIFRQQQ